MKMKPGFWRSLERLTSGAVMAEWALELGEFERSKPFLRRSGSVAPTYPCTNPFPCECRHRVEPTRHGGWVAVCDCGGCPAIRLELDDVIVHELDTAKVGDAICVALGFGVAVSTGLGELRRSQRIGIHGAARSSVILSITTDEDSLIREVEDLLALLGAPFILLTPTLPRCSVRVEGLLRRNSCVVIPLSSALAVGERAKLVVTSPIRGILDEFDRGLAAHGAGLVKTVERIDRNIEAVARNHYELRKENEELRQLNKEGYFNFAVRVKSDDFLAFAVIMALGNRKAAAEHLNIPARTFYNRVDQWESRGRDYQLMLRYMEWRKRSGRHLTVELNPSLQSGEAGDRTENPETMADVLTEIQVAESKDFPALLADVLQALERQNSGNWMNVRNELVELIKEEVMQ